MTGSDFGNKTELLRKIKEEILSAKNSPLYAERKKNKVFPVIGEGSHSAEIMFIGEAPGRNEAETGRPFCGVAGQVLDGLLKHVGIERKDVYVTNLVKDRPPYNRDPSPEEIAFYSLFLDRQIEIIRPKIIATLGRHSMRYIMEKFGLSAQLKNISQIHGRVFEVEDSYVKPFFAPQCGATAGKVKIVPLFHPAVAVYEASKMSILEKDFEVFKSI